MPNPIDVPRIFFGIISLNEKNRAVAKDLAFLIVLGFSVAYLFKANESSHNRETERYIKQIDKLELKVDKRDLEIEKLYNENQKLYSNPLGKFDTIIKQNTKIIKQKFLKK